MNRLLLLTLFFFHTAFANISDDIHYQHLFKPTQTWTELKYQNLTRQAYDYSCGASSISTILTQFYKTPVSELEILNQLDLKDLMASFEDLANVVQYYNFNGIGIATDYENLKKLTIPAIVHLNYKRNDHFSVVRAIDDNFVYLSDSSFGNRKLSKKQFIELWQVHHNDNYKGRVLLIIPKNKQLPTNVDFTVIYHNLLPLEDVPHLLLKSEIR